MTLDISLTGNAMQMAVISLRPGQIVYSEAGKFLFSSADVQMETKLTAPAAPGSNQTHGPGGFGGLIRTAATAGARMLAGESFALCHFHTRGGDGLLALAGVIPGEMRVLELDGQTTWFAEKDAFVAAEAGVNLGIEFSGLRQGMSGGEGFILERFTGQGSLLIAGAGNFIDVNPADYGGTLKVDTGCVVAWDHNISFGVERIGGLDRQGLMNMAFGGEGLSLATLTGNGRVILQSMTLTGLAAALAKAAAHAHQGRSGNTNGTTGFGSLGGLLGGNLD